MPEGMAVGGDVHLDVCYVKITNCTLGMIKPKGRSGCKQDLQHEKKEMRRNRTCEQ